MVYEDSTYSELTLTYSSNNQSDSDRPSDWISDSDQRNEELVQMKKEKVKLVKKIKYTKIFTYTITILLFLVIILSVIFMIIGTNTEGSKWSIVANVSAGILFTSFVCLNIIVYWHFCSNNFIIRLKSLDRAIINLS